MARALERRRQPGRVHRVDGVIPNKDNFIRLAKCFMEDGTAKTYPQAVEILRSYRLQVFLASDAGRDEAWQASALTVANCGVRAMLGGVDVKLEGGSADCLARWGRGMTLPAALQHHGARIVAELDPTVPTVVIGAPQSKVSGSRVIYLHAAGWRAGVSRDADGPTDRPATTLSAVTAAGLSVAEAFQYLTGSTTAGDRHTGISLWRPGADWRSADPSEPEIKILPSGAWLIGLGHLGQAYGWLLGLLPYPDPGRVLVVLQDTDRITEANHGTSLFYLPGGDRQMKTRLVAQAFEEAGFETRIVERKLDEHQRWTPGEPSLALVGVDNPIARTHLSDLEFDRVVDAGLGAGPDDFLDMHIHELPASPNRHSNEIWSSPREERSAALLELPAYRALAAQSGDRCGVELLAGQSVATAFVGVVASGFVVGSVLRELHGGSSFNLIDHSLRSPGAGTYLEMPEPRRAPRYGNIAV
jgi:hypothetical protein